ncbi:alpha/beta-hydrolase [Aaosphaeria arxii CBS 175.79]|uniref:Alpha/beta-hydrolase n=1 Tax=Aaosphaeria arxii CBS 175.79 TaxID=1450172 RepID=A0A6A5X9B4_9PLEO|nr:alpha/beta-hydrolase [Aaosphaeria arxii CBS 175.79]KAF2009347.1 alpha/beta-hydrolase [Aaosphaeria arxii CBS 175.79]
MANLLTLVFIPGAWHLPTCYNNVIQTMEQKHGVRSRVVTLNSASGDPTATFKDDIDNARAIIAREIDQKRDVVVIAHSYGGMVGNSAIKGFTQPRNSIQLNSSPNAPSDTAKGTIAPGHREGHVVGLILIASGFTLTGLAFMDPFLGVPPPSWRVNKETGFAELVAQPRDLFYHDLPIDEANYWVSQLQSQSLKALFEGGQYAYAGWKDVRTWYIGTTEDRGLPVFAQRMQVGMARAMGGIVEHRELRTSHSPFLSQPDKVSDIMIEAIDDFVGTAQKTRNRSSERDILIPKMNLWKPGTWARIGLPLACGALIGRAIQLYSYCRSIFRSWI